MTAARARSARIASTLPGVMASVLDSYRPSASRARVGSFRMSTPAGGDSSSRVEEPVTMRDVPSGSTERTAPARVMVRRR